MEALKVGDSVIVKVEHVDELGVYTGRDEARYGTNYQLFISHKFYTRSESYEAMLEKLKIASEAFDDVMAVGGTIAYDIAKKKQKRK